MGQIEKKIVPITLIMTYRNESHYLAQTIRFIQKQIIHPSEIIFIDSGSTDDSKTSLDSLISLAGFDPKVIKIVNINSGTVLPSTSANKAIELASNELLAFMDFGLDFPESWLQKLWLTHLETDSDITSIGTLFSGHGLLDSLVVSQTHGYKRVNITIPGSLIRKTLFKEIGYFAPFRAGFDRDWLARAKSNNIKIIKVEDMNINYHKHNFDANLSQIFRKLLVYFRPTLYFPIFIFSRASLLLLPFLISAILFFGIEVFLYLAFTYLILRGYIAPHLKGDLVELIKDFGVKAIFLLPAIGLMIDFARIYSVNFEASRWSISRLCKLSKNH